ncbi:MAG: hypothetical protein DRH24_08820 [Deltaproteobacteria bacterium]|nr:MAG: hypothetical protein DRH24_08820 [Deltaproteobacteria bacterium]
MSTLSQWRSSIQTIAAGVTGIDTVTLGYLIYDENTLLDNLSENGKSLLIIKPGSLLNSSRKEPWTAQVQLDVYFGFIKFEQLTFEAQEDIITALISALLNITNWSSGLPPNNIYFDEPEVNWRETCGLVHYTLTLEGIVC